MDDNINNDEGQLNLDLGEDQITIDLGDTLDIDLGSLKFDPIDFGHIITSYGPYSYSNYNVVNIDNNGINIADGADIKIGNKSIIESIEKIEERLAILKPNVELEERWEQLKELSRQYRELEKDILEKEKILNILKQ